jgi:hypothetical protein
MIGQDEKFKSREYGALSVTSEVHPVKGWLRRPSPVIASYCSQTYPVRSYSWFEEVNSGSAAEEPRQP